MIYFIQLLKQVQDKAMLIAMLDDIQWEVEELGYHANDLVNELLLNHFGLEVECPNQLEILTKWILNNQGNIQRRANHLVGMYKIA